MRSPDAEDREQSRDVEARASPEEDLLNVPERSRTDQRRGRASPRESRVEDVIPKKSDRNGNRISNSCRFRELYQGAASSC